MLTSNLIYIRPLEPADAHDLLQLQMDNKEFFETYSPPRSDDYYTIQAQEDLIRKYQERAEKDLGYEFGIFIKADDHLIGTISLFHIMRSALQSAFIGYSLDQAHNGKGYMTEAVKLAVNFAFEKLHLHRIEAGVMPHNIGSIRVLEKAGFHKEGLAIKNVKINGKWEDHQVLALINPNDKD